MKKTQTLTTMLVALMFIFLSGSAFAQTKEETHKKLTGHHQAIIKHTNAITSGEAKTKDEQVKHANEAAKSLAEAKKTHGELKMLVPEKSKALAKPYHDNIDKQYAAATTHSDALNTELKKDKPDNVKVKEHAKNLHDAAEKAEKEHQALMVKTK